MLIWRMIYDFRSRRLLVPFLFPTKKPCFSENKEHVVLLLATGRTGCRRTSLVVEMLGIGDDGIVGQLQLVFETRANRQHALLVTGVASPH